jgi:acyl-CoA thioester hydrolase
MNVRVRYPEADPMGRLHHSVYWVYFEMGRTEYLRQRGMAYADMEREGRFVMIVAAEIRHRGGAFYDDEVVVETAVREVRGARVVFGNRLLKANGGGEAVLAEATITGALVTADGRPRRFTEDETARLLGPAPA